MKDYAHTKSPCCDAMLHRPYKGSDSGRFFCADCGKVWHVSTFEGKSTVSEVRS